jgi:uncharacterized protein
LTLLRQVDKTTDLQFDLSGLREQASVAFTRRVEPASLQALVADSAVLTGPLVVELSVVRKGTGMSFAGTVVGEWELACVRCLGPARLSFNAGVEGSVPGDRETLDASEEVRQALNLALPLNARCRPDCKGLCPQCGGNRNERDCDCRPKEFGSRS